VNRDVVAGLLETFAFGVVAIASALALGYIADTDTSTVMDIAILWSIGTLWGLVTTSLTLRDTIIERKNAGVDPVLIRIANANVRREGFRLIELAALLTVGLLIVAAVNNVLLSRLCILVVVILLVANSVLDRFERYRTDAIIRQALRTRHDAVRAYGQEHSHESESEMHGFC
jgi:hypothetical protein